MADHIRINRRIIPAEQIALLETYVPGPTSYPTSREFKTRIVLIDRESVLSESPLDALAGQLGFSVFSTDEVATNPMVTFQVEIFEPSADFQPKKDFKSRLLWRDHAGDTQSKLMLGEPLEILAVAVRGQPAEGLSEAPTRPVRKSARRKKRAAAMSPS